MRHDKYERVKPNSQPLGNKRYYASNVWISFDLLRDSIAIEILIEIFINFFQKEKDMTKMAAQNENKRVFSPGNVDHQIADLALAFHLIYSLSKAKKHLFRSTLRRKETSF